jgi:hypothetical protein
MDCMPGRDLLFGRISRERTRQDEEWGGAEHDDSHNHQDWVIFISKQIGLALAYRSNDFESRMIKVAALAIAAIESSRRKEECSADQSG